MFSLPQLPLAHDEIVDNLPVVQLSECSEVLLGLITMLFPIPTVIPDSYDKALALLPASQKYDMPTVQSTIRNVTTPTGAWHSVRMVSPVAMGSSKKWRLRPAVLWNTP